VTPSSGLVALQPSWARQANLPNVQSRSTRASVAFSSSTDFSGGVQSVTLIGRQVGSSVYSARARIESGGVVRMYILRDETAIGSSYVIPGYSYKSGDVLRLAVDVTGTNPTAVTGRVWVDGTPMPAAAQLSGVDSTAAMQAPGNVGIKATSAASSTVNRVLSFKDLQVIDPVAPPANQSPVAAFTSSVSGLKVSVDGSGSSDPDGSVASYAWDFGDGKTGTGATTSHTYDQAGSFTVKLTVTDNGGVSASKSATVEVSAPAAQVLAEDGCMQYDYYASAEDENKTLLVEQWSSREAQQIHLTQPHMAGIRQAKEDHVIDTALELFDI
jgi:quinol monooxygenase YgiN